MAIINQELQQLLGDDLYRQLTDMHAAQANTDVCSINRPTPELDVLSGCQPTTANEQLLRRQRDKFIHDLQQKFIDPIQSQYDQSKIKAKRSMLQSCLSRIESLNQQLVSRFQRKDDRLYYVLSYLFSLVASITVWNLLNEKDKIDSQSKRIQQWFFSDDGYWKYVQRRTGQSNIRDYTFHNVCNSHLVDYIINGKCSEQRKVQHPLIAEFSYGIDTNDENYDSIMHQINYNESFYSAVESCLHNIQTTIQRNYDRLKATVMADALLTVNVDNYYKNNIGSLYESIQSIHERYLDRDRQLLTGIPDNLRSRIIIPGLYNDLENVIRDVSKKFQEELQHHYEAMDLLDISANERWIIDHYQRLKCLSGVDLQAVMSTEADIVDDDRNPAIELTIPQVREEYDLMTPQYWRQYTKYLNLVSLLPMHWTIGLILPSGTRIPLPIIYKFITVIYVHPVLTVIWLTINGCVVSPVVLTIDFGLKKMLGAVPKGGSGFSAGDSDVSSTWLTLFRGGNQQITKQNGGCKVSFSATALKPIVANAEEQQRPSAVIVDANPSLTYTLPLTVDDYPPYNRLSLKNIPYLMYLKKMCATAKPMMGLP